MQNRRFLISVAALALCLLLLIVVVSYFKHTNLTAAMPPKPYPPLALAHIRSGLKGKPYSAERLNQNLLCAQCVNYATILFSEAHHNHLPNASHWEDALKPYWPKTLSGKAAPFSVVLYAPPGAEPHRLAMNKKLSGISINKIANIEETVLFYETASTQQNASGDPARLPSLDKNDGYDWVICYTDGRLNLTS